MRNLNIFLLDRYVTLNRDPGYISSLDQFEIYDSTITALQRLAHSGNRFSIVTTQSGVSRSLLDQDDLNKIHDYIKNEFFKYSIPLLDIYIWTDHPENASNRRKPGSGMFLEAANDHSINLSESLMIGDSVHDIKSGNNLNMDTVLVLSGRGKDTIKDSPDVEPTAAVNDLQGAADWILE